MQASPDVYMKLNGHRIDVLARVRQVLSELPSVERVIIVPYTERTPSISDIPRAMDVHRYMAPFKPRTIEFERLPLRAACWSAWASAIRSR